MCISILSSRLLGPVRWDPSLHFHVLNGTLFLFSFFLETSIIKQRDSASKMQRKSFGKRSSNHRGIGGWNNKADELQRPSGEIQRLDQREKPSAKQQQPTEKHVEDGDRGARRAARASKQVAQRNLGRKHKKWLLQLVPNCHLILKFWFCPF